VGRLTRSDFLVYDEVNERMLAFGTRGVAAYDRAAGEWQILEEAGSHDWHWAAKAFDPLNGRVVSFPVGGMAPTDVPRQFRWGQEGPPSAFNVRTGTWTALVDTGP
jgi:hypothetical protein